MILGVSNWLKLRDHGYAGTRNVGNSFSETGKASSPEIIIEQIESVSMSQAQGGEEPKQLSAKELKAKKKAEKARKRAAEKEAAGIASGGRPDKNNQGQQHQHSTGSGGGSQAQKVGDNKRITLFDHLGKYGQNSTANAPKEVHPSVLTLALHMSAYKIIGSTSRCKAMLEAFKDVISDYTTPPGTTLSRNLTTVLSHQIDFLKSARPLSIAMGNSIRWLKQEISKVSIDTSDTVAKQELCESIDNFIRERLDVADQVIVDSAIQNIDDGDVILTYACSHVVKQTILQAHERGKKFRVIVVDSRPLFEGKTLTRELAAAGVKCTYVLITALSYVIRDVTGVFLGAHAMLSNGLLYSRVGTGMVATAAKTRNIPVLVLCESIKFTDRVQLDSVTFNELSSPDNLVDISIGEKQIISEPLKNWRSDKNLDILSVLYDLSPSDGIKKIVTEFGSLPPSSVPVVLREYKN
ncbi:hypothetical protein TRICI_002924 [Trichomonascus ciferrii]|uniref:Translation initiation factor eIF2B subunit delta n=1 Tax=Trichomonascus ciferrii TaxID=44093 RepID=A0A642V6G9_9ASCO|nr:hypothetical protein TRICI_002924 [Trichomonascus ciferrii]